MAKKITYGKRAPMSAAALPKPSKGKSQVGGQANRGVNSDRPGRSR